MGDPPLRCRAASPPAAAPPLPRCRGRRPRRPVPVRGCGALCFLLLPQFRQGVLQPDAQPLVGSLGRLPDALGYEGGSCLYGSLGDVAPQNAPNEHGGKNIARAVEHPRLQRRFYGIALAAAGRAPTASVASAPRPLYSRPPSPSTGSTTLNARGHSSNACSTSFACAASAR